MHASPSRETCGRRPAIFRRSGLSAARRPRGRDPGGRQPARAFPAGTAVRPGAGRARRRSAAGERRLDRRQIPPAGKARRGRLRPGVQGRADPAHPAPGGGQGAQGRHGHRAGDRPLRHRAPVAGADGAPEHRARARCGPDRARPALLCDGAGARPLDHQLLQPSRAQPAPAPGAVHSGLPGGQSRPPEGDHPPRPQAFQRPGHGGGRPAGAEGHRLRHRQGARAQGRQPDAGHGHGPAGRHAGLHQSRTDRTRQLARRHAFGRVRARRHPARAAHRQVPGLAHGPGAEAPAPDPARPGRAGSAAAEFARAFAQGRPRLDRAQGPGARSQAPLRQRRRARQRPAPVPAAPTRARLPAEPPLPDRQVRAPAPGRRGRQRRRRPRRALGGHHQHRALLRGGKEPCRSDART